MSRTRVILVGGFLGAGKTTLVARANEQLGLRGKRVGLITNDQAANLVDTAILKEATDAVQEVAGGCFCCRFNDLMAAMDRLAETGMPDVLIGEPVGSCTDLSATVLQPIKQFSKDRFQVAPFSVLVDVSQVPMLSRFRKPLRSALPLRFPDNVRYIFEKQVEEADLIVLNKTDLVSNDELAQIEAILKREYTEAPVIAISALNGAGVDTWLDRVLTTENAGRKITEVDYDEYAEGEAALGWLNAVVRLQADAGTDWRLFCWSLMKAMQKQFQEQSAEIAHLKLHLTAGENTLVANLISNESEPLLRGVVDSSPEEGVLLVNARARIDPARLRTVAEKCIEEVAGAAIRTQIEDMQSFSPSRPAPTHRFRSVV